MAYKILTFFLLLAIWVIFSGQIDVMHLTLGVLSAGFVTYLSSDLLFVNRSKGIGTRLAEGIKLFIYFGWLTWEVVLANLHMLRLTLLPGAMSEVKPSVVKFHTKLKSDFARFLLANSITLTPGTITVKVLGDAFYIHSISKVSSEGLDGRMEEFIAWIFEDEVEARKVFEEREEREENANSASGPEADGREGGN